MRLIHINKEKKVGKTVLEVHNLKTYFYLDEGILKAVDGASFKVGEKKTLGLIGESGSGKSVTAQSILRIVPRPGKIISGEILLQRKNSESILNITQIDLKSNDIRKLRGKEVSMIFQEPMTSLSPVHTVGNQIMEAIYYHDTRDKKVAREIALDMLDKVGISNPQHRINEYPHHLSGGLRQRVMIAMALVCKPALLIADEPTSALDVTVQAQILDVIKDLQEKMGMSILYITHNLGVVAEIADEVAVMYLGRIVEYGKTINIFKKPQHPYTARLLKAIPKIGGNAKDRLDTIKGTVPVPINRPRECGFYSRCDNAIEGICNKEVPVLNQIEKGHLVRCFLHSNKKEIADE